LFGRNRWTSRCALTALSGSCRPKIEWLKLIPIAHADLLIRYAQEIGKMINGLVRSLERGQH